MYGEHVSFHGDNHRVHRVPASQYRQKLHSLLIILKQNGSALLDKGQIKRLVDIREVHSEPFKVTPNILYQLRQFHRIFFAGIPHSYEQNVEVPRTKIVVGVKYLEWWTQVGSSGRFDSHRQIRWTHNLWL